jgi:hypothetical protein
LLDILQALQYLLAIAPPLVEAARLEHPNLYELYHHLKKNLWPVGSQTVENLASVTPP